MSAAGMIEVHRFDVKSEKKRGMDLEFPYCFQMGRLVRLRHHPRCRHSVTVSHLPKILHSQGGPEKCISTTPRHPSLSTMVTQSHPGIDQ